MDKKNSSNCFQVVQLLVKNGSKWFKIVWNSTKLLPGFFQIPVVKIASRILKMVQIASRCKKVVQIASRMLKMVHIASRCKK